VIDPPLTPLAAVTDTVGQTRRRLHPLTPLLRGGRLAVLAVAAISWRGYQDLGTRWWLLVVGAIAVAVLIASVVSWAVTGYRVVGRELRIDEGLLWRRTRAIPLERLQSVELVRPLLARLTGLAELRLEVVGAARTEAPLQYLPLAEATALRARLLTEGRHRRDDPAAAPVAVGAVRIPVQSTGGEVPVHAVANRDLVVSQLLRPHWWFLPVAILGPIYFYVTGTDVSLVALASTATGVAGALLVPVRAVLADWRFTVATDPNGLRLRRGLLETRSQTVPAGRIQGVVVAWPLLWRPAGWVRAQLHIAGVTEHEHAQARAGLLPVGTVPTAERVLGVALPGFVLTAVRVFPVPGRAFWLAPLRALVLGYQLAPTAFVTRSGLLTRELTIVPYGRIQSVRITQTLRQRLLRLASVWVDAAGHEVHAVAEHRDAREARALATELADRSRSARRVAGTRPI
jgi:putative membrane protein